MDNYGDRLASTRAEIAEVEEKIVFLQERNYDGYYNGEITELWDKRYALKDQLKKLKRSMHDEQNEEV